MSVISGNARDSRASTLSADWLASPLFFYGVLALYLAAHIALRLWVTPNIGKNDVQEALAAQSWAWGYHPRNPPLHTWLLMGSYALFGPTLLAHLVLKYLLVGAAYVFAYLSGRRLFGAPALAAIGAFSLTLLTPFAWTVHTALTHTLLLAVLILATLWSAMRLVSERRWFDYLIFGAVVGLGFLAKYSYPLFLAPLIAAMLSQPETRRALITPWSLASLGCAVLVFAPHGLWMIGARFDFVEFLAEKQHEAAPHAYLFDEGLGFGHLALGAVSFIAPLLLLAGLALRRIPGIRWSEVSIWARVLWLTMGFSLGLLALDVLVLRATQFEERYFISALLAAPLALLAFFDWRAPSARRALAAFGVGALVVVLIAFAGLTGKALLYHQSCRRCWDEMAVSALVSEINARSGFSRGTIVADHYNLAGNLRIALPQARTIAANYLVQTPRRPSSEACLLVWNARNAGDALPASLAGFVTQQQLDLPAHGPVFVDAPLRRSADRMDRFAYWVLPDADGNCEPRTPAGVRDATTSF